MGLNFIFLMISRNVIRESHYPFDFQSLYTIKFRSTADTSCGLGIIIVQYIFVVINTLYIFDKLNYHPSQQEVKQ